MQYAGEELQVHLLHCLIQKENTLSEKLAIKLGFSYCGDREIDGVLMLKGCPDRIPQFHISI
jgi:RimJ/RimL family protein N-acetyltransferase